MQKKMSSQITLFQSEDGKAKLQVRIEDETVWLTQKMISDLYQVSVKTINEHLINIYNENELVPEATIRKFRIVQREGEREVERLVDHYNLEAILAVGYRVRSQSGTQFRKWATAQLNEFLVKGFVLDDERLKDGRTIGRSYFQELIERIRDIRSSERQFYQKITDIYATSIDYDPKSEVTEEFYATVQNKLHWAIHGHTAAELITKRVSSEKPCLGLTSWRNSPKGKIRKGDVSIAKNYLNGDELRKLNRFVTMYLDYAEQQAEKEQSMSMKNWVERLDAFLKFNEMDLLTKAGTVSAEVAKKLAESELDKYEEKIRKIEATSPVSDFDKLVVKSKFLEIKAKEKKAPPQIKKKVAAKTKKPRKK
jgi:hypothetical protein